MAATAFVIPFGLFFPLQQFGSFYGQWGNLFIWFAVGFALAQFQSFKKLINFDWTLIIIRKKPIQNIGIIFWKTKKFFMVKQLY